MHHSPDIIMIQDLIAQDDLVPAIERLVTVAREKSLDKLDDVIILSRDLYSLNKAAVRGVITWQEENFERRKLSSRLLELVNMISSSDVAA